MWNLFKKTLIEIKTKSDVLILNLYHQPDMAIKLLAHNNMRTWNSVQLGRQILLTEFNIGFNKSLVTYEGLFKVNQ